MKIVGGSVLKTPRGGLLQLIDEDDLAGVGEASPLPGFSRESGDACVAALEARARARFEVDEATLVTRLDPSLLEGLEGLPAARCALETALLDLLARRRLCSVARCLTERDDVLVPVNGLLFLEGKLDEVLERASALNEAGLAAIKIKVRGKTREAFAEELAKLRAIRERLPGTELRVDANAAWSCDEARGRLELLEPLGLRFVEQPVAASELASLGRCAVPWAADESLALPGEFERLSNAPGCVAFVLKPTMLGFLEAFAIGRAAQVAGLDVVVTHAYEGAIGMAAAAELGRALAAYRTPIACGLDPHEPRTLYGSIIPQLARRGLVRPADAAGLGLDRGFGP